MKDLRRRIEQIFFPPKCVFCMAILPLGTEERNSVCKRCAGTLPYTMAKPRCKGCGRPVEGGYVYCRLCRRQRKNPYEKLCAAYLYRGAAKSSVVRFKREEYRKYAKVYARHLEAVIDYDCPGVVFDGIVSVPPRKKRMQQLGYDQAEALGTDVGKEMGIPFLPGVLTRVNRKKKQSSLSQTERWLNMAAGYRVRKPEQIKGKTVLLVDDVCTTGATLYHGAKALKEAGAKAVYCAAAAIVGS